MHRTDLKINIIRLISVLMICSVLAPCVFVTVSASESGECGDGISWTLNAGTLTISGKGAMSDYQSGEYAPWHDFSEDIIRVSLSAELTHIGDFAFYECKNLKSIKIPDSVKSIGNFAFTSCEKLESVSFGKGLEIIGESAFYNCFKLTSLRLPLGLSTLGSKAFYRCESLVAIEIPKNLQTMGTSVFAYCKKLIRAQIHAPLSELPAWSFYGCNNLSEVSLAETVDTIDNYAFKNCDGLAAIHYKGNEEEINNIKEQIIVDLPFFATLGSIKDSQMSFESNASEIIENDDESITAVNTTVFREESVTIVHTVENTYSSVENKKGSYSADVYVTVESNSSWSEAVPQIKDVISNITEVYSLNSNFEELNVSVYLQNDSEISREFLNEMSGRNAELTVISPDGSTWKLDCENLEAKEEEKNVKVDYSHKVEEAPSDLCDKVGTEDCFKLTFENSTEINAELIVQLPPKTASNTNAFLYQIEPDGNRTRLQAVAVDNDGNAHFYVGSVDSEVEYVIALNVPGESTDDLIIPDSLNSHYGNALVRLEQIEYVHLGRRTVWGVGCGAVTWILIGVLVGMTVIVGGIMFMWNKQRLKRMYATQPQSPSNAKKK